MGARDEESGGNATSSVAWAERALREAERALRGRDQLYRAVLDALPTGVAVVDPSGEVLLANTAAERLLGLRTGRRADRALFWSGRELLRADGARLLHEEHPVLATLREGEPQDAVVGLPHDDGTVLWLRITTSFLREMGSPGTFLATFADVSDQVERAPGPPSVPGVIADVLARMEPEFRSSLTAIVGYAHLLEGEGGSSTAAHEILTHGRRLADITEAVGEIIRLESGAARLQLQSLDAAEVTAEAVGLVAPSAEAAKVRVLGERVRSLFVLADRRRLTRILRAVLDNAVRAAPEGSHVRVSVGTDSAGRPSIRVEDDGPGVPPAIREHVFAPFVRGERETAGLGLTLAKLLAESMGGSLALSGSRSGGTACVLTLRRPSKPSATGLVGS